MLVPSPAAGCGAILLNATAFLARLYAQYWRDSTLVSKWLRVAVWHVHCLLRPKTLYCLASIVLKYVGYHAHTKQKDYD